MRYTEWWPDEFKKHLSGMFEEVLVLGDMSLYDTPAGSFSIYPEAVRHELEQIGAYLDLQLTDRDILLHCDLSYPGMFHTVLAHKPPRRAVVFCHASARNNLDVFSPIRGAKWGIEEGCAKLYDRVLVATHYHAKKLFLRNPANDHTLGALPHPSVERDIPHLQVGREVRWASVARPTPQKVDLEVEKEIERISGSPILRGAFTDWTNYFHFLDSSQFLVITAQEETYGYQVVDAILRGCIPIAPRAYSYPELLPSYLLYEPAGSAENIAREILWIAHKMKGRPCPQLLCEAQAVGFWDNLKEALTKW